MLKAMKDEMDKDLKGMISDEEQAAAAFEELAAAKKSGIAASSSAIESKTQRAGELAVAIVTTADDIEDTTADMKEIEAISETIDVLNDDDALDLFKKTLSLKQGPSMGFLQKKSGLSASLKARSMVQHLAKSSTNADALNLIAYALKA